MRQSKNQRGGDESVNVQAEVVHITTGLSYTEVSAVARHVFEDNFLRLRDEAERVASRRAAEVTERVLRRIAEVDSAALGKVADPAVQRDIFTVQREYAFSGKEALADILVSLMVDRVRGDTPSLREIVLAEALRVAPKIPTEMASTLTISYLLQVKPCPRRLKPGCVADLVGTLEPFVEEAATSNPMATIRHLGFAGCLGDDIPEPPGGGELADFLAFRFPGIFTRGRPRDELIPDITRYMNDGFLSQRQEKVAEEDVALAIEGLCESGVLIPAPLAEPNLQVSFISFPLNLEEGDVLASFPRRDGQQNPRDLESWAWPLAHAVAKQLSEAYMSGREARSELDKVSTEFTERLDRAWTRSGLSQVGTEIALANLRRKFPTDGFNP